MRRQKYLTLNLTLWPLEDGLFLNLDVALSFEGFLWLVEYFRLTSWRKAIWLNAFLKYKKTPTGHINLIIAYLGTIQWVGLFLEFIQIKYFELFSGFLDFFQWIFELKLSLGPRA